MDDPEDHGGWSATTARYGTIGDYGEWKTVLEHYHWDRLAEANALAVGLGVGAGAGYEGLYRMVEAEYVTRQRSIIDEVNGWLQLEWIPAECHGAVDLAPIVLSACEEVAGRLGYRDRAKTMVSVLAVEADAPWAVARFGYMVDKFPYDKVCIPNNRVRNEGALREVVAHEFAHVVVLNMAQGRVPKWLNEGLAMLAERSSDLHVRRAFGAGAAPWLSPRELEAAHNGQRQGEPHPAQTWLAYQQSAWLVRYLVSVAGEPTVANLLEAFTNNSVWEELKMRLTNHTYADEALREVYGFGEKELFDRTLDWLKHGAL